MDNAVLGLLAGLGIGVIIFVIAYLVVYFIALYKMFKKAGKKGWECFIPYYNSWIMVEISGLAWWWFLVLIISTIVSNLEVEWSFIGSIANCLAYFCIFYNISKKLKTGIWMPVLAIFFPGIVVLIIGFSNSYTFDNSVRVTENGPFDSNKVHDGNWNNDSGVQNNNYTDSQDEVNYCPNCGNKVTGSIFCSNCGNRIK